MKEKESMQRFLKELVKEDGLAAYGEESVRKNLEIGAVDTLLLSSGLREARQKLRCDACGYASERTVKTRPGEATADLDAGACPSCSSPLVVGEESDIIDELTTFADQSSAKVEIISDDFEEGSILMTAFGGIAAILRYRTGY
jgi:peptide chain release factor subunit 1